MRTFPTILSSNDHLYIPNAESINKKAISWIKSKNNKFFLWLHYMDVHEPFAPIDNYDKKELLYLITKYRDFPNMLSEEEIKKLINFYDEKIKYTDRAIGIFIERLKEEKYLDNTVIIISSDHGESFGEHGAIGHGGQFKAQLYDEYIRIPLIIWGLEKKRGNRETGSTFRPSSLNM